MVLIQPQYSLLAEIAGHKHDCFYWVGQLPLPLSGVTIIPLPTPKHWHSKEDKPPFEICAHLPPNRKLLIKRTSRMTYQRRREREKIAAAKIEAKYAVS